MCVALLQRHAPSRAQRRVVGVVDGVPVRTGLERIRHDDRAMGLLACSQLPHGFGMQGLQRLADPLARRLDLSVVVARRRCQRRGPEQADHRVQQRLVVGRRVEGHDDPAAAAEGAMVVQENAPERIEVKRKLLAQLETALSPDALILSSTSGL